MPLPSRGSPDFAIETASPWRRSARLRLSLCGYRSYLPASLKVVPGQCSQESFVLFTSTPFKQPSTMYVIARSAVGDVRCSSSPQSPSDLTVRANHEIAATHYVASSATRNDLFSSLNCAKRLPGRKRSFSNLTGECNFETRTPVTTHFNLAVQL